MRAAAALAALAIGALVLLADVPAALEAWLAGFVLLTGLVIGALGALMLGHILGENWLEPVRPALEATARTAPLVALLAVPVLVAPGWLYDWAANPSHLEGTYAIWFSIDFFLARMLLVLAALVLLALMLARPGVHSRSSATGLFLLLPAGFLVAQDLVLSRDLDWFGSLQGTALMVEQLAAALSGAILATLWLGLFRGDGGPRGVERALLVLGLLTLWLWFVQFVVVWMADLPPEAGWYLRRDGAWLWFKAGVLLPALVAAIIIAIPPRSGPLRLGVVAALVLVQHVGHLWWLLRPDAPGDLPPLWLELPVVAGIAGIWSAWWWQELLSRRVAREAPAQAAKASAR